MIFAVLAGTVVLAFIFGRLTLGSLAVLTFGPGGLIDLIILQAIPYVGTVVGLLVALFGLGALWLWARGIRRPAPASSTPTGSLGA